MTARDFQQAQAVLPDAAISPLCRDMHTALSVAWADHPEADADQLLDFCLDAMPAAMREDATQIVHRCQLDLIYQQVEQRSAVILIH